MNIGPFSFLRRGESSEDEEQILVKLGQVPSDRDRVRIENIQIAVTSVIISVYVSSLGSSSSLIPDNYPFWALALSSVIFLSFKLALAFIRPYFDHIWLKRIDFIFLPFVFLISFIGGCSLLILSFVQFTPDVILQYLAPVLDAIRRYMYGRNFMTLYVIIVLVTSALYAGRTGKSMAVIESGVPKIRFTFTSGGSDSSLPLRLENPTPNIVSPDDIEIQISTPSEIAVNHVSGARKYGDTNVWRPLVSIPAGDASTLEINFGRADEDSEISESSATVEVRLKDIVQQRHKILLEG